jgi:hypothetical protein
MSKFVLRKIRNGRVKVDGKWFAPDPEYGSLDKENKVIPYDGRLDGQVWLFGTYPNTEPALLALWGTKEVYEASKDYDENDPNNSYYRLADKEPNIINGVVQWYFWKEVDR